MFIRKVDRFYRKQDGVVVAYDYYHLTKSYRDARGKKHNRCVLGMGRLEEFTKREREELADMLTVMIEKGQCVMHENILLYEKAIELYAKYREGKYAQEINPHPLGKIKSVVHKNMPQKIPPLEKQNDT